jgi:hypothetical protein
MRTKKVLAGACASLMLAVSAIPTVTAAGSFTATIGNTTANVGGEFTVSMDLTDIPSGGINGCDFGIQYDSAVLTISDVSLGDLAKDEVSTVTGIPAPFECNIGDDLVSVIYGLGTADAANYMTGSGTFLTISGTVSDTATAGTKSDLKFVAVDRNTKPTATDVNTEIIFGALGTDESTPVVYTPEFVNGYVEILDDETNETTDATEEVTTEAVTPTIDFGEVTMLGDVNLSNSVTSADVVALNKYLVNKTAYALQNATANANADCKTNGILSQEDSVAIINHCLGKNLLF